MSVDTLAAAAARVCEAIRVHAATCQREPDNAEAVVRDGEALRVVVLDYEAILAKESGWSLPLRHLGPLLMFSGDAEPPLEGGPTSTSTVQLDNAPLVEICARYRLRVTRERDLLYFVSGRFGDEVFDLKEAIEVLFKAESWDPGTYPPGLMEIDGVEVTVQGDPGSEDTTRGQ